MHSLKTMYVHVMYITFTGQRRKSMHAVLCCHSNLLWVCFRNPIPTCPYIYLYPVLRRFRLCNSLLCRRVNYPVLAAENVYEVRGPLEGKAEVKWPSLEEADESDGSGSNHLPLSLGQNENSSKRRIDGEESNCEIDFHSPTTVSTSESKLLHSPDLQAPASDVDSENDFKKSPITQPNEDTHIFQPAMPYSSELTSKRDQIISKVDDIGLVSYMRIHNISMGCCGSCIWD